MPYSKTPQVSTYETKRVHFNLNPQQRSLIAGQDFRLTNLMVEILKNGSGEEPRYSLINRPGLATWITQSAGQGRGIYYWPKTNTVFYAIGNVLYAGFSPVLTLANSTGAVGFAEHINNVAQNTLNIFDGIHGYVFTDNSNYTRIIPNTWTASTVTTLGTPRSPTVANGHAYDCTTAGTTGATEPTWTTTVGGTTTDGTVTWTCREMAFPTPHTPQPVFMDGYMFLAKAGTADIYNCDLNYPLKWSAGNYITCEMYPGNVVALTKNNNYVYAVCDQSIQYFYDAANPTGTPLANRPEAVLQFGTPAPETVTPTENEVILVGQTGNGQYTVWKIDGFKAKEISTPPICNALTLEAYTYGISAIQGMTAQCLRIVGQKLYLLFLTDKTLVYDFTTDMWSEWLGPGDGAFDAAYGTDNLNTYPFLLGKSNGYVYTMRPFIYTDAGHPYNCTVTTPKLDFDTINRKTMSRFSLIGDTQTSDSSLQTMTISWSDDDYNTWISRDLQFTSDLPSIHQLGRFRRRAFKITTAQPLPFRLDGIEVDINKGTI